MAHYIDKDALVAEIDKRLKANGAFDEVSDEAYAEDRGMCEAYRSILSFINTIEVKEDLEIDKEHKIGKWFTGLIPCWIDAPSTLQAAHDHHGKNIVAIHLKDGGYRCCCVDDKEPITFSLPENVSLVEGWHNIKSSVLA